MSDIFISYSKADHALALKLSTFLESEGWTVWWDRSLGAADLYRDEIMKQLAAARAVITIWTENSIRSDWVRAEAGRAKADGKLIPVKTSELTYGDIPLPFGEMHTENVASTDLIRAAVVAQLAKPAIPPSQFWQIKSTFKYQVLTWIGIMGSAITLFANLNGVLNLADWAQHLVAHWQQWNQIIWGWVFSLIRLEVPKEIVPIFSFTVSVGILVAGINLSMRAGKASDTPRNATLIRRKVGIFAAGVLLYFVGRIVVIVIIQLFAALVLWLLHIEHDSIALRNTITNLVAPMWGICFPLAYLLYFTKERSLVLINSLLFILMGIFLLFVPLINVQFLEWDISWYARMFYLSSLQVCWMAVILFSPLRQLTRRLVFVALGFITLVLLSGISKLNLHQYLQPAKVSDNSVR